MKAFVVDRYRSKAGLRFGDMPNPELRDDDVMVQVCAAGVNPLDAKIRDGEFKLPARQTHTGYFDQRKFHSGNVGRAGETVVRVRNMRPTG